jgi:hypothetical protein
MELQSSVLSVAVLFDMLSLVIALQVAAQVGNVINHTAQD